MNNGVRVFVRPSDYVCVCVRVSARLRAQVWPREPSRKKEKEEPQF